MSFKGIDYEEIGNKISGASRPENIEADVWVKSLITSENFPVLRDYLKAHIDHLNNCHTSGGTSYLGIYKAIDDLWVENGSDDDNFNFIKAFITNMPMMWC